MRVLSSTDSGITLAFVPPEPGEGHFGFSLSYELYAAAVSSDGAVIGGHPSDHIHLNTMCGLGASSFKVTELGADLLQDASAVQSLLPEWPDRSAARVAPMTFPPTQPDCASLRSGVQGLPSCEGLALNVPYVLTLVARLSPPPGSQAKVRHFIYEAQHWSSDMPPSAVGVGAGMLLELILVLAAIGLLLFGVARLRKSEAPLETLREGGAVAVRKGQRLLRLSAEAAGRAFRTARGWADRRRGGGGGGSSSRSMASADSMATPLASNSFAGYTPPPGHTPVATPGGVPVELTPTSAPLGAAAAATTAPLTLGQAPRGAGGALDALAPMRDTARVGAAGGAVAAGGARAAAVAAQPNSLAGFMSAAEAAAPAPSTVDSAVLDIDMDE